jgi:hypothetical protein
LYAIINYSRTANAILFSKNNSFFRLCLSAKFEHLFFSIADKNTTVFFVVHTFYELCYSEATLKV